MTGSPLEAIDPICRDTWHTNQAAYRHDHRDPEPLLSRYLNSHHHSRQRSEFDSDRYPSMRHSGESIGIQKRSRLIRLGMARPLARSTALSNSESRPSRQPSLDAQSFGPRFDRCQTYRIASSCHHHGCNKRRVGLHRCQDV